MQTLRDLAPGATGAVTAVTVPDPYRRRLAELGVRPGACVTLLRRTAGRGVVVGVAGARLALDRATAAAVRVTPAAGAAAPAAAAAGA